jgi:hypothetical protein
MELPDMDTRLLSPEDLVRVTGAKRYSKQRRWFKEQFGIDVVRRDNSSIVMTWDTFDQLIAKRAGVTLAPSVGAKRVDLCYD